jgi:hypothetical protein
VHGVQAVSSDVLNVETVTLTQETLEYCVSLRDATYTVPKA